MGSPGLVEWFECTLDWDTSQSRAALWFWTIIPWIYHLRHFRRRYLHFRLSDHWGLSDKFPQIWNTILVPSPSQPMPWSVHSHPFLGFPILPIIGTILIFLCYIFSALEQGPANYYFLILLHFFLFFFGTSTFILLPSLCHAFFSNRGGDTSLHLVSIIISNLKNLRVHPQNLVIIAEELVAACLLGSPYSVSDIISLFDIFAFSDCSDVS